MSRNAEQWMLKPKFPETHFVDSRIYTDESIFREEQQKVFSGSWIIGCHESELPGAFDYRTFTHPAGTPLILVRGEDQKVRAFYNVCPHRGNTLLYDPVGNAKRITCIFHQWSFDTKGNCVDITREQQGFQNRYCKADAGAARSARRDRLRRIRLGQPRRQRLHAEGIHRRRAVDAGRVHVDAARGVPLPQGGRPHELQAVARHEQRVLSRLSCTTSIA
jgi:nitrite reductase/ring-hydroxylating ferredoxin subunit